MKRFLAAALLATTSIVSTGPAQSESVQFGPAYAGVIEAVVDGRRVPLERQTATASFKTKAFGFGGGQANFEVAGPASRIRIRNEQKFFFISRFSDRSLNPQSIFELYTMRVKKHARIIPYIAVGALGLGKAKDQSQDSKIPLVFEPFQKEFVKIQPASPIPPGEYFFTGQEGLTGYAFGVD